MLQVFVKTWLVTWSWLHSHRYRRIRYSRVLKDPWDRKWSDKVHRKASIDSSILANVSAVCWSRVSVVAAWEKRFSRKVANPGSRRQSASNPAPPMIRCDHEMILFAHAPSHAIEYIAWRSTSAAFCWSNRRLCLPLVFATTDDCFCSLATCASCWAKELLMTFLMNDDLTAQRLSDTLHWTPKCGKYFDFHAWNFLATRGLCRGYSLLNTTICWYIFKENSIINHDAATQMSYHESTEPFEKTWMCTSNQISSSCNCQFQYICGTCSSPMEGVCRKGIR